MAKAATYTVRLVEAIYTVRAAVDAEDRTTGAPTAAVISSVKRNGVEIGDEEFEPIALQLEDAIVEQWSDERATLRAG